MGHLADQHNYVSPPTCYYARFGHCSLNHMGIGIGSQEFGDAGAPPLWMGVWLTLETDPSPHVIVQNLVVLGQGV